MKTILAKTTISTIAAALLLLGTTIAFSQSKDAAPFDSAPSQTAVAQVNFEQGGRTLRAIQVYPADRTDGKTSSGLFFHRPALALIKNPQPLSGLPPIVHRVHQRSDSDRVVVELRLLFTSKELRSAARNAVVKEYSEILSKEHVDPSSVQVRPWPVIDLFLECKLGYMSEDEHLATGRMHASAADDQLVYLDFDKAAFETFKTAKNADLIVFNAYYTYAGRKQASGDTTVRMDSSIAGIVSQNLSKEQVEGTAPIFWGQVGDICQRAATRLEITKTATEETLLSQIDFAAVQGLLFDLKEKVSYEELSPEAEKAFIAYLTPLIETVKKEEEVKLEDEQRKEQNSKSGGGFNFGIKVKDIGIGSKFDFDDTDISVLSQRTGVTFRKDSVSQAFVPVTVAIYKLAQNYATKDYNACFKVRLGKGLENGFLKEIGVPVQFTDSCVKELTPTAELSAFQGLPLGAMIPFFGAGESAPKGFVWANGKAQWPNEDWVPKILRGQQVPNMDGVLIGGRSDEPQEIQASANYMKEAEAIKTAPQKITGSSFTLDGISNRTFKTLVLKASSDKPYSRGEARLPGPRLNFDRTSEEGKQQTLGFELERAAPTTTTIGGSATVSGLDLKLTASNIPFLKTRWIIRVQ